MLLNLFLIALLLEPDQTLSREGSIDDGVWKFGPPEIAKETSRWSELQEFLRVNDAAFSLHAIASRSLSFVSGLEGKVGALKSILYLVQRGYPFSVKENFLTVQAGIGSEPDFSDQYHIYKFVLNFEQGMGRWAEFHKGRISDLENPKLLFFEALWEIKNGKRESGEKKIREALKSSGSSVPFARTLARTLARLLFEEKRFEESYEIYSDYLLKTPITEPRDFLEAAWNLYYLKRYTQSLGLLYNFESKSTKLRKIPEIFVLRALIHRSLCRTDALRALETDFNQKFLEEIKAIKTGKDLAQISSLRELESAELNQYRGRTLIMNQLDAESESLKKRWKAEDRRMQLLYEWSTEREKRVLKEGLEGVYRDGLKSAARELIMISEQIRFLIFDVERERLNPDLVFAKNKAASQSVSFVQPGRSYLYWTQLGDFWRDERTKFVAREESRCGI